MTAGPAPAPAAPDLTVTGLTVAFSSNGYVVRPIDGLSFRVGDGELAVLLGPSGCGKTTLLSCLAGLLTPTAGSVDLGGVEVTSLRAGALNAYRSRTVGIVFQSFNLIPSLSARGNVMVPLRLAGIGRSQARARAEALLSAVDLMDRSGHRPQELSGGQQQRVAIARALAHDPPLVLADEPTAHLDYVQVEGVLRLIRSLASPGRTVVVATHDDRLAELADRVVELQPSGRATATGPVRVTLGAGEVLFEQGDPSDLVYVVESGRLEVFLQTGDGRRERIVVVPAGGYVGELGPLLKLRRSASVAALEPTVLTGYDVAEFRHRFPGTSPGGRAAGGASAAPS
jgi:putative ABC transport system ATP-binding protein